MLKVDRHTTLDEFGPWRQYISADDMAKVRKAAVRDRFGEEGFYGMTVGDLTTVLSGDPRPLYRSGGRTLYDAEVVEAFGEFIDQLYDTLKRLTLPPTADGVRLSAGTLPSRFAESLYLFCRQYFCLKNFESADGIKVSEYLLARKDDYNRQVVDRNTAAAMKGGNI